MTKALQRTKLIEKGTDKIDAIAHEQITKAQTDEARDAALLDFGAITAMWGLQGFISSQVVLALQRFQESKGFESLKINGERCKSMDEFLDRHPQSPMGKNQYYSRLGQIKAEGPDVYD